ARARAPVPARLRVHAGPRAFGLSPRVVDRPTPIAIFARVDSSRAWAEIDLDALAKNLGVIRRLVGPTVAILLVAKADAYGHGATAIAHHALRAGAQAI